MEKKLGWRTWLTLILVGLFGQFAWTIENMYFNVFLYNTISNDPGYIAAMVAWSAGAATVTTLVMGALSDRVGKRKIFICVGYLLWGLSTAAFGYVTPENAARLFPGANGVASAAMLVVILDCVMTFFGSSANDACFNAWLTDSTDETNRGTAEGVNAMMPLLAILVVFGGFMGFDLDKASAWVTIFTVIGAVVLVIGVLGFFLIREPKVDTSGNQSILRNVSYGFRPSVVRQNPALYWTLAAFAVFGISIQIFMPYLILYYEVTLGMENYVMIMAPAIVLAAVVTVFYGKLYDKYHFRGTLQPALGMLGAGYVLLFLTRATAPVFLGSLLMMSGYLAGMAVFGAMIRDNTPANRAGMFQGLRIVGQVLIPGVIGPWIGALVLRNADTVIGDDGTASFIPHNGIFLAALIVGVLVLLPAVPLLRKQRR